MWTFPSQVTLVPSQPQELSQEADRECRRPGGSHVQRSLKLLMGFLLWLLKSLCAVIQDAATEIKASCTCIIREKWCPEHGAEPGCGRGCRGAGGWGAVPGQSCAGALHPACAAFRDAFVPVMMWEWHSSLFWISTGGLRSDRSSLHDCRRCKTAQDPDLISAVFYPAK